jgi:hypothetical protein
MPNPLSPEVYAATGAEVVYEGRWCVLVRVERTPGRKTDRFHVVTKDTCDIVGEIRWYARWRKYAFCPKAETAWEETCLLEIAFWIAEETTRHRTRHAARRTAHA